MKLLALGTLSGSPQPYLEDEMRRVAELEQEGLIESFYLRADRRGAVLMLESSSAAQAQAQLDTLPLVQHHLLTFELVELVPPSGGRSA